MPRYEFGEWLSNQLARRGLSQSEFSRRMETSHSSIYNWISGRRIPTPESCDRISDVLHLPLDLVLTQAGHRVEMPSEWPKDIAETAAIMRTMTDADRREVLDFVRWRFYRNRERRAGIHVLPKETESS